MTGTCKYTNMGAINRPVFLECVKKLEDKPKGTWLLGRSYSFSKEYDKTRKKSNDEAIRILKDQVIEKRDNKGRKGDANVKIFTAKEKKQSILAAWKLQTDPTSKVKLNALIDQYKNEAKSLGAKIIAKKSECTQTAIEIEKERVYVQGKSFIQFKTKRVPLE